MRTNDSMGSPNYWKFSAGESLTTETNGWRSNCRFSIINGFAVPLKDEHKLFLVRVLIPLHKTHGLTLFHPQVKRSFVLLDGSFDRRLTFAVDLLYRSIHRKRSFTRRTNSSRLVEILAKNVVEKRSSFSHGTRRNSRRDRFADVQKSLRAALQTDQPFRDIGTLSSRSSAKVNSANDPFLSLKVAERALALWSNEYVVQLIEENLEEILPILLPPLCRISKSHWNTNIITMTYNLLRNFMEINKKLCDDILNAVRLEEQKYDELVPSSSFSSLFLSRLDRFRRTKNARSFGDVSNKFVSTEKTSKNPTRRTFACCVSLFFQLDKTNFVYSSSRLNATD